MSKLAEPLTIRFAFPGEREELEDLQRRASLALPDYRALLETNPDAIALPEEQIDGVLVAEVDGRVAGFAALIGGELDGLFVEPAEWRRGIGSALVERAAHEARKQGLSLTVTAAPQSRIFYESCGFSLEGEAKTRFGPALRMSR
jgi:N-acetylglutamate synthase-like GNAT family acetyltransferase